MDQGKLKEFEPVFYPKSIAVVGVSQDKNKAGSRYLRGLLDAGFKGKLYGINSKGGEIWGIPIYPNLRDIPEPVEYVIVSIPRQSVLDLLDDCAAKGVKVAHLFTAGFSESGTEEGRGLEAELVSKVRKSGVRIIGPNCLGVHCPASGMRLLRRLPEGKESGSVAFICQSGGHTGDFIEMGLLRGLKFSKVVSFGNGCDLDSVDFLEYLAIDPETKIIGAYLEGVRDGSRLLKIIKEAAKTKPVIIWKGGVTEAGAQTAISHTGAVATSDAIWAGALKQVGAIKVESLEELVDTILALQFFPRLEGNQIAIIAGIAGAGGGASVVAADACLSQGLEIPSIADEIRAQLQTIVPPVGSFIRNPIDVGAIATTDMKALLQAVALILSAPEIDIAIIHIPVNLLVGSLSEERFNTLVDNFIALKRAQNKPVAVVSPQLLAGAQRRAMENRFLQAQIPVYPTFERAAKAIANLIQYWKFPRR